jgi:hypothetical protein
VDIYREETERRWQIPRAKTKQIYEFETEGGDSLGEEEKQKQIDIQIRIKERSFYS